MLGGLCLVDRIILLLRFNCIVFGNKLKYITLVNHSYLILITQVNHWYFTMKNTFITLR